ncbi:MAG: FISUMP domain-containing protein [bacterium]
MNKISLLFLLMLLQISTVFFAQSPCPDAPYVSHEGKVYHTVQIGNQCWLKENLNVGIMIDLVKNASYNKIVEKYCYGNDTNNCNIYGGLYQWKEAMQYATIPRSKGICPDEWHIPTLAEFQTLEAYVNNNADALKANGQEMSIGDDKNSSGFSALFGGYRSGNVTFENLNYSTHYWTSTEYSGTYTYFMYLSNDKSIIYFNRFNNQKGNGLSVRCIKD